MTDAWNPNAGTEHADRPEYWPPRDVSPDAGVIGKLAGFGSFTVTNEDGSKSVVPTAKLATCVQYVPPVNGGPSELRQHLALHVPISADLRNKLDAALVPVGTFLQITYRGIDATQNNMKMFRVATVTERHHHQVVLAAVAAGPQGDAPAGT